MNKYQVAIIGAGPAGYVSAIRASQLGLKTVIIDKQWLGGVCLNVGCIPSKALLRNAEIANILRNKSREFGFSFDNLNLDYSQAVKRSRKTSDRLTRGVGFLMKKNKIDVVIGKAQLVSPHSLLVTDNSGQDQTITADNIVIATGASTIVPPGWSYDGEHVLTYHEAILQEKLPKSVIVIGSGAIGVEFSTIWNAYGTEVTIVEMLPRIVPLEDEEISAELEKSFKKQKINVLTSHRVEKIVVDNHQVIVTVSSNGQEKKIVAEQALIAIGFKPNIHNIGLSEAGVRITEHGSIEIDERMATNVPGIWAIGDVTAKLMLAHVGSAQGIICAENIAGVDTVTLDYTMMPRATYCHPQIASFGLTESQAIQNGLIIDVARFPFMANGKALGLGEYSGWIKIITDKKYNEIIGAHLIGPEVTELLPELTLAHMAELTTKEIARNIHAHPTLSEVIMEAAHAAEGQAIHI